MRNEKNKSKVITIGGSYGATEGRRKQTKGRSKTGGSYGAVEGRRKQTKGRSENKE